MKAKRWPACALECVCVGVCLMLLPWLQGYYASCAEELGEREISCGVRSFSLLEQVEEGSRGWELSCEGKAGGVMRVHVPYG